MDLALSLLWNVPFVLVPLLGLLGLFAAPAGRRMLPALGLVLVLIDGVGDLLLSAALNIGVYFDVPALMLSPGVLAVSRYVLTLIFAIGLLLIVLGIVRRVRAAPGRAPDPAWSAPPPTPVHPGYGGPTGNPGYGTPANPSGGHGGYGGSAAQPPGPNPGAGAWPASSGRPDSGPQPASDGSGPDPSAAPPPPPGSGAPPQPPGTPPQTTG